MEFYLHERTETDSGLWCKPFRKLVCKLAVRLDWKACSINKEVPPLQWNKLTNNNVNFLTSGARKVQCQACLEQAFICLITRHVKL